MVAKELVERMKNKNGFTLIEMLLVLFIVLLTASIVFQIMMTVSEKRVADQFFQQVVFDIQEMQALAIEQEQTIVVQFNNYNQYKAYHLYSTEVDFIFQKDFPQIIKIDTMSNLKRITISPNGNVKDFGTIDFKTPFGETHLIIYIKEGRMRLVE